MSIILNSPIVRVDGVQIEMYGLTQDFFTRMKKSLKDENVYDISEAAVPFTNRMVTFTGTADSVGQALTSYNETKDGKKQVSTTIAAADKTFEVSVRLRNGKNKISVEASDGMASNAIQLNAYKLDAWLFTYAEELDTIRGLTAQLRQDRKLQVSTDFEGNVIDNTGQGLTDSFGQFITPLLRLEGSTVSGWRQGIRDIFEAYGVTSSVRAMNLATRFFTGLDAEFKFYKDASRLRRPLFSGNYFQASAANPTVDTTFIWQTTNFHLYNRWWIGQGQTVTLATGATSYIYYDGTATTGIAGANKLTNGDFEVVSGAVPVQDFSTWTENTPGAGSVISGSTTFFHDGAQAMHMHYGGILPAPQVSQAVTHFRNEHLGASYWSRTPSGTANTRLFLIYDVGGTDNYWNFVTGGLQTGFTFVDDGQTTAWQQIGYGVPWRSLNQAPNVTGLSVRMFLQTPDSGTDAIIDETAMTPGAFVDHLAIPIVTTIEPIVTGTRTVQETISSGDIFTDLNGSITGLSGELYVRASFPVSGFNGVSGQDPAFSTGLTGALLVPTSSTFIDLGHAQLGQSKPQYFGNLELSYETPKQIFEVAQVMTDSTTITGMITGQRFDEASGVIRETQVAQHAGELLIHNSGSLVSGVRNLLTGVLIDVKPPRTFWHVFMNDPTSGKMNFYAKV